MSPLTGVLREAWATYKTYAAHFLVIAFVLYLVAAAIAALLSAAFGLAGGVAASVIDLFCMFLLQAALVKAVQDVRDGRVDLDLRGTLSAALPYVLPVAAASILAAIGIVIGFALLIVPGLILLTYWSLIVPSIVIGESRTLASFGQSWRTVRGFGWNVFGTYVVVFLILIAVRIVLSIIFAALPLAARSFIGDIVSGTLIAPVHRDRRQPGLLPADRGAHEPGPAAGVPAARVPRRRVPAAWLSHVRRLPATASGLPTACSPAGVAPAIRLNRESCAPAGCHRSGQPRLLVQFRLPARG